MTREEAIEALTHCVDWAEHCDDDTYVDTVPVDALKIALEALKQPEHKKGKWIESIRRTFHQFHPDYSRFYSVFYCTYCLKENDRTERYCPNCGAQMDEAEK